MWLKDGRTFIIAEIGVNHNGDIHLAKQLIDVASEAGADAVKFQTFKSESLVTRTAKKADYQQRNDDDESTNQLAMLKSLELSLEDLRTCKEYCHKQNIKFLSTPFCEESVDNLVSIGVEGFKMSSGDLTNTKLIQYIASKNLPTIISTGMATMLEVAEAVDVFTSHTSADLALLHCVSDYPASPADCNLRAMATLERAFNLPVGWSDHTLGDTISIASVALGARILEKHFTLDRNLKGPDHKASLTPQELSTLITNIRNTESALGNGVKRPTQSEANTAQIARRSICSSTPISQGTQITSEMITLKRPASGIQPKYFDFVVGRIAQCNIPADTPLSWEMI